MNISFNFLEVWIEISPVQSYHSVNKIVTFYSATILRQIDNLRTIDFALLVPSFLSDISSLFLSFPSLLVTIALITCLQSVVQARRNFSSSKFTSNLTLYLRSIGGRRDKLSRRKVISTPLSSFIFRLKIYDTRFTTTCGRINVLLLLLWQVNSNEPSYFPEKEICRF